MPMLDDRSLPVLTAIVNSSLEAALVAGFARPDLGITVVRRCVDLVELLSAAAAGTARVALLSSDLRGLDRESLAELGSHGVSVVGLAAGEAGERLLHQLGANLVVAASASPEQVAGAMLSAAEAPPGPEALVRTSSAEPADYPAADEPASEPAPGRVIAVWGPTGAPGRTTIALGLADALAGQGVSTMLIDGDPYGGTIAAYTGLLDESPGVTAACRAANAGLLDVPRLAECCRELGPRLRVLTGLSYPARWPELRPASLERVIELSRRLAAVTVIDTGFCLEDDDELSYDTLAPQRNAATLASLRNADQVVVVAGADPTGVARLIRELPALAEVLAAPLAELVANGRLTVVMNRLRPGLVAGNPLAGVTLATQQHVGITPAHQIPLDQAAADATHGRGQLLSEAAPNSALRHAIAQLTAAVGGVVPIAAEPFKRGRRRRIRTGHSALRKRRNLASR
jgi:MinD-like ATPase involved in chromosome partitioning or flagellar assembly